MELSTLVTTHGIFWSEGKELKSVKVSEEEARVAETAWRAWRPVPVPNKKDDERSCMLLNPQKIDTIKRYRYIT